MLFAWRRLFRIPILPNVSRQIPPTVRTMEGGIRGNWRVRRGPAFEERTIPAAPLLPTPPTGAIIDEDRYELVVPRLARPRGVAPPTPELQLPPPPPPPIPAAFIAVPRGFDNRRRRQPGPYKAFGTRHGRDEWKEALQPGTVFYATMHHEDFEKPEDITRPDRNQSLTYIGGWVYSKKRKFIVIKQYNRHFIAIPIYTNGGQGLAVYQDELDDWIGVRDSTSADPPPSESNHANVIFTRLEALRNRPERYFNMLDKSHAKLTHPVSFKSDVECDIEGNIADEKDVARLIRLYYKDAPKETG